MVERSVAALLALVLAAAQHSAPPLRVGGDITPPTKRPTLQDGKPVPVVMMITIAFFLAGLPRTHVIEKALASADERVRSKTVQYLADSPAPDSVPLLRKMLDDPDSTVREAAQRSIRKLATEP